MIKGYNNKIFILDVLLLYTIKESYCESTHLANRIQWRRSFRQ